MKTKSVGKKAKSKKEDFAPTRKEAEAANAQIEKDKLLSFEMVEIKCNVKKSQWSIRIDFREAIQIEERFYKISFVFNKEPFQNKIDLLRDELAAASSHQSLFDEEDRKRVERCERDVESAKAELIRNERISQRIEFVSEIKKLEYGNPIKVVFSIPNEVVSVLNEKLSVIELYGIKLSKIGA